MRRAGAVDSAPTVPHPEPADRTETGIEPAADAGSDSGAVAPSSRRELEW